MFSLKSFRNGLLGTLFFLVPFFSIATGSENPFSSEKNPGYGYPGELTPYEVSSPLQTQMKRYHLTAGRFKRAAINPETYDYQPNRCPINELPYLLFSPKRSREPVPLVLYFGGTGEHGTDLLVQFGQTLVFEKVTASAFQERHPCYLLAPLFPKGLSFGSGIPEQSSNLSDLTCDTMYAVIASLSNPPVDTNRVYITGLSYGGYVAYQLPCHFPGRFAASVPVSTIGDAFMIPQKKPVNFWFLYNDLGTRSKKFQPILDELVRTVRERGGECRLSTFPDKGHDAWSKAWREDRVWDWMFSKTADGSSADKPSRGSVARPAGPKRGVRAFLDGAVCTASQPGRDAGSGPERAADSLEATCYVSAGPAKRGDWWQIEFAEPVSGLISVQSGMRDGKGRASGCRVEISIDGRHWNRAGNISVRTGDCRFRQRIPIRFLRVLPEPGKPEPLILREVSVETEEKTGE